MEFLRNHRLPGVTTQPRRRHVEQNRIVEPLGRGFGRIAETDIDTDGDASARDICCRPHAESPKFVLLTNTADSSCAGIEHDPVRLFLTEHLPEDVQNSVRRRIAVGQKIEIARAAKRLIEPCHQQHGTLENETIGVSRLREAIEQALDRIVCEDQVEILALLLADPEETGPNRGPDVPDLPRHWR